MTYSNDSHLTHLIVMIHSHPTVMIHYNHSKGLTEEDPLGVSEIELNQGDDRSGRIRYTTMI